MPEPDALQRASARHITRSRLVRISVATLVVACLAYVVFWAPLPFIPSWWRSNESNWGDRFSRRHRMADWLIYGGALVGKTRADVVALLGEPPPTEYFKDWHMVYNLGAERGFISIDSEWLVLRLDAGGIVTEATLRRD